jgi:hypothetical protein
MALVSILRECGNQPGRAAGYDCSQALDEFIACALHNMRLTPTRIRKATRNAMLLRSIG